MSFKDLSRLGRNYLEVGNLAEVFLPEHGCELISLTEKMDEMMVFRNWFNEQHSRETSKKVRAVKKMCAQNGKFLGSYAPFGYRKSDENKHLLVPDETAAAVVRKIFELRVAGKGYKAIANHLNEAGIVPPRDYYYRQQNSENPQNISHKWCNVTVKGILINEVYIGNMVSAKYGSISYKSHKLTRKSEDEWIRVEGTHEPLIEPEIWDRVQDIAEKSYQPQEKKEGTVNIFAGILRCADCGFVMRRATQTKTRKNGNLYSHTNYMCGAYSRSGKSACTTHTITENDLIQIVIEDIRAQAQMVKCDEKRIVDRILRMQNDESASSRAACKSELKNHRNRLAMLDKLIEKLYEDRVTGTVPETTFRNLIQKYENERLDRQQSALNLENRIQSIRQNEDGASKWVKIIKCYTQLETLDAQTLLLLVDRVEVGERQKSGCLSAREVKIIYNYVGDLSRLEMDEDVGIIERGSVAYEQVI